MSTGGEPGAEGADGARGSDDRYRTVAGAARAEIPRKKGSRFVGLARPAASEEEVDRRLGEVEEGFPDATHRCWAYRIGEEGRTFRFSDDGEPSGTAGRPILDRIAARELVDVLVVVVRHYGGTKLGTGPLSRAYGEAAVAVLEAADLVVRRRRIELRLRFGYDDTSAAEQLLHRFDVKVRDRSYGVDTEWRVEVARSEVQAFRRAFTDALADRGTISADS